MSGSAGRGWIEPAAVVRDLERKGVSVRTEPDADAGIDWDPTHGRSVPDRPGRVLRLPVRRSHGVPSDTWPIWKGPVGTLPGRPT